MLIHAFSLSASHFVSCTVEVPFWPPCFYWFFGSCFGSHDEAGCWHSRRSKADRGLPEARMAGATVEETAFDLRTSTCGRHRFRRNHPLGEPRMWQAKSGRRDLMGSQTVARPSLERGMEAQVGRRELRNTKASPREGEETAESPLPPIQCATHPIGHPQGGLLSITLYFLKRRKCIRGHFLVVLASAVVLRKGSPHPQGHPQASARALADME